ncbi:MAG TPA: ABC transporter substrate-binding protein [Candidatus Cybelea sp.]|jgi:peptide/nickel transport system substrate-binding protein|nr:ABC transporter substrate-binding protein [Candidatus Cybelea sp.]
MRNSSRIVAAALLLIIAIVAPHPAARAAAPVLRLAVADEPASINPFLNSNPTEGELIGLIFSGLLGRDPKGAFVPDLALAVPSTANGGISADGKRITFHLRHGVRWQDGAPFDASDVVFTYLAAKNPKLDIAVALADLVSVSAPDRWTVVFRLSRAHAEVLGDYFASPVILPRHLLSSVADLNRADFNVHPIGTGPYAFDVWQRGVSIDLRANPYYYGRAPAIPRVRFVFASPSTATMMLRTGEMDVALVQASGAALLGGSSVRLEEFRRHSLHYVSLNMKHAPLDDVRVRRAFELAIDRSRLVATIYHGNAIVADALVPPYDWGYAPLPAPSPDAARAGALLDRAGWRMGADGVRVRDGKPLSVDLVYLSEQAEFGELAVQLQSIWAKIGVRVELRPMAVRILEARDGPLRTGNYDMIVESFGFPNDSPDRSFMLEAEAVVPHGYNDAYYADPDVRRWDDAAEYSYDQSKRKSYYRLIQQRVARDVPYIPIAWVEAVFGYSSRLRRIVVPSSGGVYTFVGDWSLSAPGSP